MKPSKRLASGIAIVAMLVGAISTVTATAAVAGGGDDSPHKAYVCKYVGTPGVNERLQTGQNPIDVSINAIGEDPVVAGSYFNDAQGRSYVLALDTGQSEPSASSCPSPAPDHVTVVAPTYTPGTCLTVGTVVATNTAQYTWAASGTEAATYETASAVGNVVLDGQTVFGPYDLSKVTGDTCPSPPPCVVTAALTHTYDPSVNGGVITATGEFCDQVLYVTPTEWAYTTNSQWPQSLVGDYTFTISAPGTYPYGKPVGCGQGDIYAQWNSAIVPTSTLSGPSVEFTEHFLHQVSTGPTTWVVQNSSCYTPPKAVFPDGSQTCNTYTLPTLESYEKYPLDGDGNRYTAGTHPLVGTVTIVAHTLASDTTHQQGSKTYTFTAYDCPLTAVTPVTPKKTCDTDTNTPNPGFTAEQIAALQPTGVHTTDNGDGTVSFSAEDGYVLTDGSATTFSLAPLSALDCAVTGAVASVNVAAAAKCDVTGVATDSETNATLDAPLDQSAGKHTASFTAKPGFKFDNGDAPATLTKDVEYTIPPATTCGGLALTGSTPLPWVLLGYGLLMVGLALVVIVALLRRRRLNTGV